MEQKNLRQLQTLKKPGFDSITGKSCIARRATIKNWFYRVIYPRRKFGEHERREKVAQGGAKSNSSFLSALQTSQVHP